MQRTSASAQVNDRGALWLVAAPPCQCPLCHSLVQADDAVGVIERRAAHAECVLACWLGEIGLPADVPPPPARRR